MRSYEMMLAINPQLEDEKLDSLLNKVKKVVKKAKGEVTKIDKWGKRKLAYEIKDFNEAIYVVLKFNADEKKISELERVMKLEERVIRYLLILQDRETSSSQEEVQLTVEEWAKKRGQIKGGTIIINGKI